MFATYLKRLRLVWLLERCMCLEWNDKIFKVWTSWFPFSKIIYNLKKIGFTCTCRHLKEPQQTLEAMLRPKLTSLPGHIQSVYVQNLLKLYCKVCIYFPFHILLPLLCVCVCVCVCVCYIFCNLLQMWWWNFRTPCSYCYLMIHAPLRHGGCEL
jgi:hypothetical protein